MKDIITDLSMTETKSVAAEKWREYVAAEKIYRKPEYTDMKNVYNQIKQGRKVIDIFKVIQRGGVHDNHHPKLAIAQINVKKLFCKYHPGGTVEYINRPRWAGSNSADQVRKFDVSLPKCLPVYEPTNIFQKQSWGGYPSDFSLSAPVPPVPPQYMPKVVTDDYYILWEVDKWEIVPPTDPWLLRRITKTLFVVLAGWDLTELEKSVMHGRMI